MAFNLGYIVNKFLPVKLIGSDVKITKIRAQVVASGATVLLGTLSETDPYSTAKVSLRMSANGSFKLYAQHLDELSNDYGTTDVSDRTSNKAYLSAKKRSSIMKIYFVNNTGVEQTINADVIGSFDESNSVTLRDDLGMEFIQKGDPSSGAANTTLYGHTGERISNTNPLPVIVHGQSTEVIFDGAITAEKYGEPNANVSLSAETDENGQGVLRTIDSNPWAYDAVNDTKKMQYAPKTWTVTREVDNAVLNATKSAEPTKYYIIKGAYVSTSDGVTPTKWAILDGDITMAQGYAVGAGLQLTAPIKITGGNSVTLRCWPNGVADVKVAATLIGETFNVGD